jgi:hypothetical protein
MTARLNMRYGRDRLSPRASQEFAMTHNIVQTSAADTLPPFDPATFWAQFHHDIVAVKGVRLHFVEGGSGAPILLVPGWRQSWYAWRYVMPLLTGAGRRVISLDPRGIGDSDRAVLGGCGHSKHGAPHSQASAGKRPGLRKAQDTQITP